MILSKREKLIAVVAAAAVGLVVLDFYVLTPFLDLRTRQADELQTLTATLNEARALFDRRRLLRTEWHAMNAAGLGRSRPEAESVVFHAVRDWAQESGLQLGSLKPGQSVEHPHAMELTFQTAATGPMQAVAGFLWRVESAPLPLRVHQLQLGARKDGEDDLSLQLHLSTLCHMQPADDAAKTARKEAP
jgi:Tfp pilus assembly protein PilO